MRIPLRVVQTGVVVFALTFSTLATAQHYLMGDEGAATVTRVRHQEGIRELPVQFPQGRLYCANGSLAYMKLHPQEWQRISSSDAVRLASQSVDEACAGGDPVTCKEYRVRLSKLRLAVRGCF